MYRELVAASPDAYRPHLATSLSEALRPFPGNLVPCSHAPTAIQGPGMPDDRPAGAYI
jgi:hypothetical protein